MEVGGVLGIDGFTPRSFCPTAEWRPAVAPAPAQWAAPAAEAPEVADRWVGKPLRAAASAVGSSFTRTAQWRPGTPLLFPAARTTGREADRSRSLSSSRNGTPVGL